MPNLIYIYVRSSAVEWRWNNGRPKVAPFARETIDFSSDIISVRGRGRGRVQHVVRARRVYSSCKADRPYRGYTLNELVEKLSNLYDIPPCRTFRQEVALALRRGVDYGILVKTKNKYRFDPEKSLSDALKRTVRKRRRVTKSTAKVTKSTAKVAKKHMGMRNSKEEKPKNNPPSVPRPTVPPPPKFTPTPRNLVTEPFNKVIKHRSRKD